MSPSCSSTILARSLTVGPFRDRAEGSGRLPAPGNGCASGGRGCSRGVAAGRAGHPEGQTWAPSPRAGRAKKPPASTAELRGQCIQAAASEGPGTWPGPGRAEREVGPLPGMGH